MKAALTDRADTFFMGVMHDALRRDLSRISIALASAPAAHERQEALAEHLAWMMSFLHVHHSNEDEKLWPLVRERRPAARTCSTRWTPTTG